MCSQKCISGGPLFSAWGGSGPQQARGGLQEAIRCLRQDASQIQLGKAGPGSGLSAAACQSEQERAGVQLPEMSGWNINVCQGDGARLVCAFCLQCINVHHVFACMQYIVHVLVWMYPNTYRACVSSVRKLQAGSLGKCSPIHRNQWRI